MRDRVVFPIIIACCIVFLFFGIVGGVILGVHSFLSKAPTPEVTHGEIPFKLIYQYGDEIVTVEDTYVCDFQGKRWSLDAGHFVEWDGYIKGTKEERVIVTEDGDYTIEISIGSPEWYMNLSDDENQVLIPKLWKCGAHGSMFSFRKEDDYRYNIEILSFTFESLNGKLHNWNADGSINQGTVSVKTH